MKHTHTHTQCFFPKKTQHSSHLSPGIPHPPVVTLNYGIFTPWTSEEPRLRYSGSNFIFCLLTLTVVLAARSGVVGDQVVCASISVWIILFNHSDFCKLSTWFLFFFPCEFRMTGLEWQVWAVPKWAQIVPFVWLVCVNSQFLLQLWWCKVLLASLIREKCYVTPR